MPPHLSPPTFIVMTADDPLRIETATFYSMALTKAKVPAELHTYATGGHGYGLRPTKETVTSWPHRAEDWMRGRGLLQK